MSATLGALLRLVEPDWSITLVERLDGAAAESSDSWNNAGTGHSALCELNYTPEQPDGSIDITKAVKINEQFQLSRQFWAYAVENRVLADVRAFLNPVPHVELGAERQARWTSCAAAEKRWRIIRCSRRSNSSKIPDEFARRLPLMSAGRDFSEPIALNWARTAPTSTSGR